MSRRRAISLLIAAALTGCAGPVQTPTPGPATPSASSPLATPSVEPSSAPPTASGPPPAAGAVVYLHYYLWWTPQHWRDKLGPDYPYRASPEPLPGDIGADGCGPSVRYPGATIVDLPSEGLYDQGLAATFDRHVATAAAAGVTGFLASWQGTGLPGQTPASSGYDRRLDLLVQRVHAYDATHATPFRLGLAFAAFGDYTRPAAEIIADLTYFADRYGHDPAFVNAFSAKPLVMILDSRKFPLATIEAVSRALGSRLELIGDETAASWSRDAPYLAGSSYYWSSQNPWSNPGSAAQVAALGSQVHAAGKPWFAPFIAGYDKELVGGSCVPRKGLLTLDRVWQVNRQSHPDAWFGISWNEFVENTYLEPSLRYGTLYLDELRRLIAQGS
jgi:hypothetical protein